MKDFEKVVFGILAVSVIIFIGYYAYKQSKKTTKPKHSQEKTAMTTPPPPKKMEKTYTAGPVCGWWPTTKSVSELAPGTVPLLES